MTLRQANKATELESKKVCIEIKTAMKKSNHPTSSISYTKFLLTDAQKRTLHMNFVHETSPSRDELQLTRPSRSKNKSTLTENMPLEYYTSQDDKEDGKHEKNRKQAFNGQEDETGYSKTNHMFRSIDSSTYYSFQPPGKSRSKARNEIFDTNVSVCHILSKMVLSTNAYPSPIEMVKIAALQQNDDKIQTIVDHVRMKSSNNSSDGNDKTFYVEGPKGGKYRIDAQGRKQYLPQRVIKS